MNDLLKGTAKFAIGTCVTLCAVTVAASVAVGTNLGKVVAAGFKGAKGAIKEELATQKAKANKDDAAYINVAAKDSSDETNASVESVEN
ncbi:MAG: hypothetical protein IJ407_04515 [Clostridia bacterium]|nr:hypothetical protein [Clostridia bacterium]